MRITALNGNIDEDKILPHIKTSQDIHLQPVIGTKLLDKCKQIIADGTLDEPTNSDYKILIEVWITPALVFWTMWDFMPFHQYTIANGGIYQHQSENSATPDDSSVTMLIQKFKDKAEFYGGRLTEYLCDNSTLYPELLSGTTGADLSAGGSDLFHGWVM